jgi:hypothetical protein
VRPKAKDPVIAELAGQGFSTKRCCRILGVAPSGCFMWRRRAPSPRQVRFVWLTELVRAIHTDSGGTDGWRRVNGKLPDGHSVIVYRKTVRKPIRAQTLHGFHTTNVALLAYTKVNRRGLDHGYERICHRVLATR